MSDVDSAAYGRYDFRTALCVALAAEVVRVSVSSDVSADDGVPFMLVLVLSLLYVTQYVLF